MRLTPSFETILWDAGNMPNLTPSAKANNAPAGRAEFAVSSGLSVTINI